MAVCERLLERGFYTQGIRYPSVPEGTARLRITPMATHADAEIDALAAAVAEELAAHAKRAVEPKASGFMRPGASSPGPTPASARPWSPARCCAALRARGIDVGVMKPIETGVGRRRAARRDRAARRRRRRATRSSWSARSASRCRPRRPSPRPPRAAASISAPCDAAFAALAARHAFLVVEGAGGCSCPRPRASSMADLARELGLPLLLVARASLGTINHTRLTLEAAAARGLALAGVVISHGAAPLPAADLREPRGASRGARSAPAGRDPDARFGSASRSGLPRPRCARALTRSA